MPYSWLPFVIIAAGHVTLACYFKPLLTSLPRQIELHPEQARVLIKEGQKTLWRLKVYGGAWIGGVVLASIQWFRTMKCVPANPRSE